MTAPACDLSGCRTQTERDQRFSAWLLELTELSLFDLEASLRTRAVADGIAEDAIEGVLATARDQWAVSTSQALQQFRDMCAGMDNGK